MSKLKAAVNHSYPNYFPTHCEYVSIYRSSYIDVAIIILSVNDVEHGKLDEIDATGYGILVSITTENEERAPIEYLPHTSGVFERYEPRKEFYGRQLETAANHYKTQLHPPFFRILADYVNRGNSTFDCPGHQRGEFFHRRPAGNQFMEYFDEILSCSDLCNVDIVMGDLLIHESAPYITQQHTARVFNADKTYFVSNSIPSSGRVVLNTLLTPGNLVLSDRNSHKPNYHGALLQAGAAPICLEATHNPYGFIDGIDTHCFEESYLRESITEVTS